MADEITNRMLLEHMQAMKNELTQKISSVDRKVDALGNKVDRLEQKVDRGFAETRLDIRALQEDLQATMQVQADHARQLRELQAA